MKYNIEKIIEAINSNGRQGPKDLLSEEVFSWVKEKIDIKYEDYKKVIQDNTITISERQNNRDAYFVFDVRGKIQLFKSNEEEIRKYICYIIKNNPNITSSDVRKKFKILYQEYTLVDLMDQKNLSSHQDVIDQTVRNILVSNYSKQKNNILFFRSLEKPFTYQLKPEGFKQAEKVEQILFEKRDFEGGQEFEDNLEIEKGISIYSQEDLDRIEKENRNFNIIDLINKNKSTKTKGRLPTDSKIKATRFYQTEYKCECNSDHITFPTVSMTNFLEGHHLVPLAAQRNFKSIKLDRIENMVALCPICHSQIHYGTREAKRFVFDKIVSNRIDDLKKIGFTKEILDVIFDMYY